MALPLDTLPSPDIGTSPPWMRRKPMRTLPAANDFDSQLASMHGAMAGLGPSPTDPGRGGGAMAPSDWTPNANVQQMFPGMGSSSLPSTPSLPGRGLPGGPPIAMDPAPNAGGAFVPGDDLHQTLSKNYDTTIGKSYAPMMEASSSVPAPSAPTPTYAGAPKMAAASSPQMEAGGTAAPAAPAEDPFLAAIRNNTSPGAKPPWMIQRDADLLAEATGEKPAAAADPATTAAAPAAAAPAAPPTASMSSVFGSTPGVAVAGTAPWEGANPIAMTRANDAALPEVNQDFSEQAQRGADAAYKGATQFFDKDFSRDRAALETQLENSGFARGSEGFDAELEKMMRSQNAARENAGFAAQGVGHAQAGDLLQRALASRAALMGERERDADRTHAQTVDVANLGLGARAQDKGVEQASLNAAGASAGAGASLAASKYGTDASTNIALRQLGLSQDAQGFNQLMQLIASSRGGVNMPNFGAPTPVDVGGANSIASSNANAAANRAATDRAALYNLGGAALGSIFRD